MSSVNLVTRAVAEVEPSASVVLVTRARARTATGLNAFCSVGESDFWFPVAPGTETLPPPPEPTTNANPLPPNAVPVPPDFDPNDLCYLFQDLLPVGQPPVYATELEPDYLLPPYEEEIPLLGITVAGLSIREWPYELTLPEETVALVTRTVIQIPTFLLRLEEGSFVLTGQAASIEFNRKVFAGAGSFTLSGFGSGFVRNYVIGTNAGTFTLSGQAGALLYGRLPLAAEAGSFALSGQDADKFIGLSFSLEAGSFAVSGEAAGKLRGYVLSAGANAFELAGQDSGQILTPAPQGAVITYTGNATNRSLTGAGFKPGFIHIARSNAASFNYIHDYRRGSTTYWIYSDTGIQATVSTTVTSFNSDGFSLGTNNAWNGSGLEFIAFLLKEGGSSSTNTDGTITTTTNVNSYAEYSIFTYTGNGTAGATIGHGLSGTPDLVIIKNIITTGNVAVLGSPLLPTNTIIDTNSTASATDSNVFQAFGSTTLTLGNSSRCNASGRGYVGYAFKSSNGIKVGTYTGVNPSTVFVNTGQRPKYFFLKTYGSATSNHNYYYRLAAGDGDANFITMNNNTGAPGTSTTVSIDSTGFSVAAGGFGNTSTTSQAIYFAVL